MVSAPSAQKTLWRPRRVLKRCVPPLNAGVDALFSKKEIPSSGERFRNFMFTLAGLIFVFGGLVVFALGDGTGFGRYWELYFLV